MVGKAMQSDDGATKQENKSDESDVDVYLGDVRG